jgi:hypothetical protein
MGHRCRCRDCVLGFRAQGLPTMNPMPPTVATETSGKAPTDRAQAPCTLHGPGFRFQNAGFRI